MAKVIRLITLLVCLTAMGPTATGAPPDAGESDGSARDQAGTYYGEGRELFDKELYDAAIEAFRRAHLLSPAPANLYNIAKSYERLGASAMCISHYEDYLRSHRETFGRPAPDATDVRNAIDKCRLGARVAVSIESDPPAASVAIDDPDKMLGQTPLRITRDPGTITVHLSMAGYQPFEQVVEIRPGEPLKLVFKLERIREVGTVRIQANIRGAGVFIDGRNIGLTPYAEDIEVSAGDHQITVAKDDYHSHTTQVTVAAGGTETVSASLFLRDPPATWKGFTGWPALTLGAAGIVGGVVVGGFAEEEFAGTPDFETLAGYQKLAYGIGGALLTAGVALVVLEFGDVEMIRPDDDASVAGAPVRWTPYVGAGPDHGWAGIGVTF